MRARWKNLLQTIQSVVRHLRDTDIRMNVYSLSFITLLSLVPFCILTLGFFKYSGFLTELYPRAESLLLKNMTGVAGAEVSKYLQTLVRRSYTGSFGFLSMAFLIYTTNRLGFDLERAINRLWHVRNPKNLFKRLLRNWVILFLFPVALGINISVRLFLYQFVTREKAALTAFSAIFLILILWGIFSWLPNHPVKKGTALVCAVISAVLLFVLQNFFGHATQYFFSYNKFYGSLATLPLFLIWLSGIWFAILFGVGLNASLQKNQIEERK